MKPEKQDWEYRFLMKSNWRSLRAAASPLSDAIDLAAAVSELEDRASIYHGIGLRAPARVT
jgi:hypothetical protein